MPSRSRRAPVALSTAPPRPKVTIGKMKGLMKKKERDSPFNSNSTDGNSVFIRANENLFKRFFDLEQHEFNCVPCSLRLLGLIDDSEYGSLLSNSRPSNSHTGGVSADRVLELVKQKLGVTGYWKHTKKQFFINTN